MSCSPHSDFIRLVAGKIKLETIPFSDAGSRLLLFRRDQALILRLAERWGKWERQVGHYRERAPMVDRFIIADAQGTPVDWMLTAYPHALCFDSVLGRLTIAFADQETLYVSLPPGELRLSWRVYADAGRTDRRGGEFKGDSEHRNTHRNVAYTTNARILENTIQTDVNGFMRVQLHLKTEGDAGLLLNITPRLGFNRSMPQGAEVLRAAEQRWNDWFACAPQVDSRHARQYYYAWWVLRAGLLSPRFFLTHEAMIPSLITYVGIWGWDAYFHALAYRHVDTRLAENQLRVIFDHQRSDGMVPDAVHDEGALFSFPLPRSTADAEVTKPPLAAWAAYKLYQTSRHRDFLDELYEPLVRNHRWWMEQNDDDNDGIVQYNHPFSSGADDNPLWDEGMPVESPDINTYLVMDLDALAAIADVLGLAEDAARWRAEAQQLTERMVAHFWDEQAGVFWAQREHKRIPVLTPFNLFPLLTGRLPRAVSDRLVAHLFSPDEFWLAYPIPSVAANDPKFDPRTMWRGPTWVNINYMFIEGLVKSGYPHEAQALRDKTLELLMHENDIYEYYNPVTGAPPPRAASVFGWSSAVLIDLVIHAARGELI